ncbi:PEP-CTERM sorting domain-containing protein [Pseudoduganella rhizocola]|uniref:PEP-CTERM sorting domain-containing protein n=1 Tax=Pseudoduganella rhizocola TaxID=3382643 RepID=UPI0038B69928
MKSAFAVFAVLLGMLSPLHAQERHDFAYSDLLLAAHVPSGKYFGTFEGQDNDGDGMLELEELSYFSWNKTVYISGGTSACTLPGYECPVFSFLYPGAGHGVFFYVQKFTGGSLLEETIVGLYINHPREPGSGQYAVFNSSSRFYLDGQMVPIPEPSALALLLAGLASLGMLQLKRRRSHGALRPRKGWLAPAGWLLLQGA